MIGVAPNGVRFFSPCLARCASTSQYAALKGYGTFEDSKNGPVKKKHQHYGTIDPDEYDYIFACVRNPYSRILSLWRHIQTHPRQNTVKAKTFSQYVERVYYRQAFRIKSQLFVMSEPLTGCIGRFDYIGRFENFGEFWGNVCSVLDLDIVLSHEHKSAKDNQGYTKRDAELVWNIYVEDFGMFEYSRDSWLEFEVGS